MVKISCSVYNQYIYNVSFPDKKRYFKQKKLSIILQEFQNFMENLAFRKLIITFEIDLNFCFQV